MNTSNIKQGMKLSDALSSAADHSTSPPNTGFLRECARRAGELEYSASRSVDSDVRDFHLKFGHPAPEFPVRHVERSLADFRIKLIREECEELCEAIVSRSMSKIAAEACDLVYVVVGTLVALGMPLMPFWRDVQRANMAKKINPAGGKPLKPVGWVGPNPARVLYNTKTEEDR